MNNKHYPLLLIIVLLGGVIAVAIFSTKKIAIWSNKKSAPVFTLESLPKGVVFNEHEDDESIAEDTGGFAMQHYATPDALRAGGPIYGTMGYRIVSIEYEIPEELIKERPVGKEFAGWSLILEQLKGIRYDHIHVGATPHAHYIKNSEGHRTHSQNEKAYLIHFMLMPHEEEIAYGLVCS